MNNYENLKEIQTASEEIFDGVILHVYRDEITLPNGNPASREVIRHVGAVGILPMTEDGKVIMERQFRYPMDEVILEIPAGKLDSKQEDRLEAAKRELKEETGFTAEEWIDLGMYYPAAAYCDERLTIYLAKGLHQGTQNLDEDEFLNIEQVPLTQLVEDVMNGTIMVEQVMNGEIRDGKTQVAILKAAKYLDVL